MRGLKATLTLALALSLTAIIRCFAAQDPLMKEAHGLFEPVPSFGRDGAAGDARDCAMTYRRAERP